ncbi:MAG: sigma 54-interacting transcriptional regulator [Thermodesulfobacteriota bacterium]|nr:sigma 54-interacting transcriptional regulator [Thermodesulfobacteriota bacterium]
MKQTENDAITPEFALAIVDAMADGVFTLDKNGRITSWNPAMERITGYTAQEALGRRCTMLEFNNCFGRQCPTGFQECGIFDVGAVESKECLIRHKDGDDVPVMKNARVVWDNKGTVIGVVETVTDLTELQSIKKRLADADRRLGEKLSVKNIIGTSQTMQRVFQSIKAAAASDATVLVFGESGTGKELVASAIHQNSIRSANPLVTVNCSALSESLLESELFGHARGAFTGAIRDRKGRFEEADGGTVFLDEIGDIAPFIQLKLLRVLQERTFERVGETKERRANIRVITATNRDLLSLVNDGHFRQDLYYRLKVFPIHVPPLRNRREDIPLLVTHFIGMENNKTGKAVEGISAEAIRLMMDYHWPGNVRELENAIEHSFVLCRAHGMIDVFDLPVEIRKAEYHTEITNKNNFPKVRSSFRTGMTKADLMVLLEECGWNKAEVARRAGVSRTAIWKYMKKWDIPLKPPDRSSGEKAP